MAKADVSIGDVQFAKGQRVYLDLAAIGRDQGTFSAPLEVNPTRSPALYQFLHGDSVFKILGEDFVYGSAAGVLRAVFTLKNVRRAPGPPGTLRRYVAYTGKPSHTCLTSVIIQGSRKVSTRHLIPSLAMTMAATRSLQERDPDPRCGLTWIQKIPIASPTGPLDSTSWSVQCFDTRVTFD